MRRASDSGPGEPQDDVNARGSARGPFSVGGDLSTVVFAIFSFIVCFLLLSSRFSVRRLRVFCFCVSSDVSSDVLSDVLSDSFSDLFVCLVLLFGDLTEVDFEHGFRMFHRGFIVYS